MERFAYVIVGAGSAGAILASRLSEDANVSVCVLEAGGYDWNPFIHIPAGFMKTFYDASVNWKYDMEPAGIWMKGFQSRPPASRTQTVTAGSSLSRFARMLPADPAPTIT